MNPERVIFHRDNTVTYWSVYRQCWTREAVERIPPAEVAAMPAAARARVIARQDAAKAQAEERHDRD